MYKISIPKPCFEGWENMLPNERGRYCNSCAKTVVDFSVMSDEAVQQYFISNAGQKICGHFKNSQVERIVIDLPRNIFRITLPFWKKFLVVSLICFGSNFLSIDTTIAGTSFTQAEPILSHAKNNNIKRDTSNIDLNKKKSIKKNLPMLKPDDKISEGAMLEGLISIKRVPPPACDTSLTTDTAIFVKNKFSLPGSKKIPLPKTPLPDNNFVLPEALTAQNNSSKKKKA
jgi:hypothetical protein